MIERRTLLQGAAASIVAARFAPAAAQGYGPSEPRKAGERTIIYNKHFEQLNRQKFNPFKAPPELLSELGLPRLPDKSSPLYETWLRILGGDLSYERPLALMIQFANQTNPRFQQAQAPLVTTRYESSPNWSGAYVHPRDGNMIIQVAGTWQIPAISMPGGPVQLLRPASSVWIGLDGRGYFDASLPQIGTRQEIDETGAAKVTAWYQWWVRGQPSSYNPQPVGLTLTTHDIVFCTVQMKTPTQANVSMTKLGSPNQLWAQDIEPDAVGGITPRISGATAEWVVERPTVRESEVLYPLPRVETVVFSGCYADAALPYQTSTRVVQNLDGARFIDMFDRVDGQTHAPMLAKPSRLVPDLSDGFQVTYTGP